MRINKIKKRIQELKLKNFVIPNKYESLFPNGIPEINPNILIVIDNTGNDPLVDELSILLNDIQYKGTLVRVVADDRF